MIVGAEGGVAFEHSSVPAADRSRELADYPTDLLNSPPQDREGRVVFTRPAIPPVAAARPGPTRTTEAPPTAPAPPEPAGEARTDPPPLQANPQATPRSASPP